jgi:PhnB protein
MAERPLIDRLDETVDALLAGGDATAALRDAELAPLARLAADLRHYPSPDFKTKLRAQLERSTTMTAATMTTATAAPVREGFTTVTPYIWVPEAGLVDFLTQAFDAQETFHQAETGGGAHREVRIGDSMVMIAEGGPHPGMPIRPAAFHIFVKDADETFKRAIAAGATSLGAPADRPYGERSGFVADRFGNHWFISTPLGPHSVAGALRSVTPFLHAPDASAYIEFLQRALGAVEEMRHEEGGQFRYGRVRIGDAAIELGEAEPNSGMFVLYVQDPDARYQRALDAGATSVMELTDRPNRRTGGVKDPMGNQWYFTRPATT